ncbi:hypothetical protein BKA57DRAFT_88032 [Linnemannia elongata]|nr:hypothetical protein BKA57DRAFT_88032 [Linnemannia elongata]
MSSRLFVRASSWPSTSSPASTFLACREEFSAASLTSSKFCSGCPFWGFTGVIEHEGALAFNCLRSLVIFLVFCLFSRPLILPSPILVKKTPPNSYILNGLVAGTAVLIEAPGRQMELALYCLPRALETSWKLMMKRGLVRNIKNGDIALFSASMGVLMTLYQNEPSVINKHYLTVLTRVFGRN